MVARLEDLVRRLNLSGIGYNFFQNFAAVCPDVKGCYFDLALRS
jgi:hypothetical protein